MAPVRLSPRQYELALLEGYAGPIETLPVDRREDFAPATHWVIVIVDEFGRRETRPAILVGGYRTDEAIIKPPFRLR